MKTLIRRSESHSIFGVPMAMSKGKAMSNNAGCGSLAGVVGGGCLMYIVVLCYGNYRFTLSPVYSEHIVGRNG